MPDFHKGRQGRELEPTCRRESVLTGEMYGNAGWKQQQTSNGLIYLMESGNYPARGRTQSTGAGL